MSWGRPIAPLLLLSALLLVLSFPPFDQGWLAWVALVPWLAALRGVSLRQAFFRSYLVGFLFFGAAVWWVGHVTVVGAVILAAYLALFFAAWGVLAARLIARGTRGTRLRCLAGLPAAWALLEFLRNTLFSGFGWNPLAHTQWNWLPLIQAADLAGAYGISYIVVKVNVALWQALPGAVPGGKKVAGAPKGIWGPAPCLALAGLCLLGALAYGDARLQKIPPSTDRRGSGLKIALLQGNIPQTLKWDQSYAEEIWNTYDRLTQAAAAEKPDLIVWPETAVPGFLEEPEVLHRLERIARASRTFLLVGAPTERVLRRPGARPGETGLFNSAILLAPDGTELRRYDKIHLVPFGEFIPVKPLLGWLQNVVPIGDFTAGQEFTLFKSPVSPGRPALAFSVLICFEDLFPGLTRVFRDSGAQALFVITNDGWFGRSAASLQHLQASVFRAVEGRVWVVRAANNGWTGFVDPAGRRLPPPGQIPRFEPGFAVGRIAPSRLSSPYTAWGEAFLILCAIMVGLAWKPSTR
ncbi:MAG: apolipoprotein N-acyltransferase [Candidatus Omnitrophica bacterium]|nr:apolipoprotein N-acyltransferase [Candidatus Omnitrophota bacterium]